MYDSDQILPLASGMQWITFWRGNFPPLRFDSSTCPGSFLSARILPHLWGSEDVPPSHKFHQKYV